MTLREQLIAKNPSFVTSLENKYRRDRFFTALREKNNKEVRSFISSGIDVNILDDYGDPAIFVAIDNNDYKSVKCLINHNANIHLRDHDGQTTLMHAAFIGSLEIAELLILKGVDVNATDLLGQTAFMMAAQSNEGKMGELLLLYGADINIRDSKGKTAAAIAKDTWYNRNVGNFFLFQLPSENELLEKRIVHFFTYFFPNKSVGAKLDISEIKKSYFQKYNCNLLDKWLNIGIDYWNHEIYGYNYELKKQADCIIYYPNKKEIYKFLKKCISNFEIGDVFSIENLNNQFESFYKIEAVDYSYLRKTVENSFSLKKLADGSYQLVPDELTKKGFLDKYLKNKSFGDVINIAKIQDDYCNLYKVLLEENFLCSVLNEKHYEIQKLNATEWELLPDINEKNKFLTSIFSNKYSPQKYTVRLEELRTDYFNKFHCELKNDDLLKLIRNKDIKTIKNSYEIKRINKQEYVIIPDTDEIFLFLDNFVKNTTIGTSNDICKIENVFRQKYDMDLGDVDINLVNILKRKYNFEIIGKNFKIKPGTIEISKFLNQFTANTIYGNNINLKKINESFYQKFKTYISKENKYQIYDCLKSLKSRLNCEFVLNNKCIQDINEIVTSDNSDVLYLIVPSEKQIQKWIESIPYKCPFKLINKNKDVVVWINTLCEDKGIEFRPLIHNSDDFILTYNETNIIDIVSEELRDIFLHEIIGFSILKEEFLSITKEKYDFSLLDNDILEQAFNEANRNLMDLQIIDLHDTYMSKSINYYSDFKEVINTTLKQQCPLCKESIALPYLKDHLLIVHTTKEKHRSIIENDIQHPDCFRCNHCNQDNLVFYDREISISRILGHFFGECKKSDFWPQGRMPSKNSETNDTYQGEKIYTGSAYANNSSVLGNSGHIYREHGRFSSYPEEDYDGDGDSVQ